MYSRSNQPKNQRLNELSDEDLVTLYQDGDEPAFEEIYRRHSPKVYGYLKTKLRNSEETDEVFQSTFLKFHRTRDSYDPKYALLQWLFVISRSVLIDYFRSRKRISDLVTDLEAESLIDREGVESPLPEDGQLPQLDALSPDQRQVVQMRLIEDQSYEEIARQLERSEANIRQIFSRAVRKLKEHLKSPGSEGSGSR